MSKDHLTTESLHADVQVGIYIAFDWTLEEMANQMGVTVSAINNRKANPRHRGLIDTVAEYARLGVARLTSERIRRAEDDFQEKKRSLHRKGYATIEKKLNEVVADESKVSPDAVHLRAAEMAIERTEGKPLDRKAILQRNESVTTVQVDAGELDAILGEMAQINAMRKPLMITGKVQDAEVVER